MKLIIYNINSFGGSFDYTKEIYKAASASAAIESCVLIMPANAPLADSSDVKKMLMTDKPASTNKWLRKLHFLYRTFVNPLRFYRFLKRQDSAVVIFNDFDQLSSIVWSRLFRRLKRKHQFGVILHDPDRDQYLPVKSASVLSMKKVMSVMDAAFFHEYLPEKPYYAASLRKVNIPHGIYPADDADKSFEAELNAKKGDARLIGILGNIRDEKNYSLVIEALQHLPGVKLLVAGAPSNSKVDIDGYHQQIKERGLQDRVIWVQKYLSSHEMAAAINACDIISLYYKPSFTSQSGILNVVAPFKKKLIIANIESAMQRVVSAYQLGIHAKADSVPDFVVGVQSLLRANERDYAQHWTSYLNDHSWEKNVAILVKTFKQ